MKVKVIREFKDKHTNELHELGSTFDVTNKRFKEIQSVGDFVQEIKEEVKPDKPEKAVKKERKTK